MTAVLITVDPTRILAPVLTRVGENMIPFHAMPVAVMVRLLVGMYSVDPELISEIDHIPGLKVIPVAVAPLRYILVPVNEDPVPLTKLVTTVTIRVILPVLPAVSTLV